MAHLQLRRKSSGDRVLPVFYSDNYVWLAPGESRTITIDAAQADLKGDLPLVVSRRMERRRYAGDAVPTARWLPMSMRR